jgi:hypothetical protein
MSITIATNGSSSPLVATAFPKPSHNNSTDDNQLTTATATPTTSGVPVAITSVTMSSPTPATTTTSISGLNGDSVTEDGERVFLSPLQPPPLGRFSSMRHSRKPSLTGKPVSRYLRLC